MSKNISNLNKSLKQNITPSDIGAADASHGTHLTLGTGASNAAAGNHTHSNYATSSHNHGLLHDNFTVEVANTTTDNGWSMINSTYNGYLLKSMRFGASSPAWGVGNYGSGIAFGGGDTKGVISMAYNSPSIKFAAGNGTKPVWNIGLTGTSGTNYNLNNFASSSHGTHVPTPQTASNTKFLRNDNTWQDVTCANIGAATAGQLTATNANIGALSSLQTSNKSNLVAAINEVFQSANNGKQLIASAIGTPLSSSDTFSAMSNDINSLLSTFKTNMINAGASVESEDKFKSLIDKIATLADNEGKSVQYAEGTYEDFTLWLTTSGSSVEVPYELDFTPTLIFVKFDRINNTRGTTITNAAISNKGYSNFYMNYGLRVGIENISSNGFQIFASYGDNSNITFTGVTWYAIGVGEESNSGLDIISATALPSSGKKDQICVITNNPTNNFLITTNFNDTQSTSEICIYLGDPEDVLPSSKLTITKGKITNIYYFNRVCQQNKRLASYYYANNQWNLLTKATIPVYENGSFPSENILGVSPVKNSTSGVFLDGNEIFFGTANYSIRGFTFPNIIDFSSYHKVTIVARLSEPSSVVGTLYVASMKKHYTSTIDLSTNTLSTSYAYSWVKNTVSNETAVALTFDISSFTGNGYLGIVAGGSRSQFYIREIILE